MILLDGDDDDDDDDGDDNLKKVDEAYGEDAEW